MDATSLGWLLESSGAEVRSLTHLPGLLEALQVIRNADTTTVEWSEAMKRIAERVRHFTGPACPRFGEYR